MYSRQIHDVFHSTRPPRGVIIDLVDYGDYIALRLYRDNFDSKPESIRVSATEWVMDMLNRLNMLVPCSLEAWETPPEDK